MKTRILKPIHFNSIEEFLFQIVSEELSVSFALHDYNLYNLPSASLKSQINQLMWRVKKLNILSVLHKYTANKEHIEELSTIHISKFKTNVQFREITTQDCLNAIEYLKSQIEIRYIKDINFDLLDAYSFLNDVSRTLAIFITKNSESSQHLEIA